MPITEAIPDETQALRSKLITLPKTTTNIPVVSVAGAKTFTFTGALGQTWKITPSTSLQGANTAPVSKNWLPLKPIKIVFSFM